MTQNILVRARNLYSVTPTTRKIINNYYVIIIYVRYFQIFFPIMARTGSQYTVGEGENFPSLGGHGGGGVEVRRLISNNEKYCLVFDTYGMATAVNGSTGRLLFV